MYLHGLVLKHITLYTVHSVCLSAAVYFPPPCRPAPGPTQPLIHFLQVKRNHSGSLGLFVSSPLGPFKSQHCGHIGLLYSPRMIHEGDCGVIGERTTIAGETEVIGEKLPQCHFVHHKSNMT
jgi:hypothetical protein